MWVDHEDGYNDEHHVKATAASNANELILHLSHIKPLNWQSL